MLIPYKPGYKILIIRDGLGNSLVLMFTRESQKEARHLTEKFPQFPTELETSHEVYWNPIKGDEELREVYADEKYVELCLKLEKYYLMIKSMYLFPPAGQWSLLGSPDLLLKAKVF